MSKEIEITNIAEYVTEGFEENPISTEEQIAEARKAAEDSDAGWKARNMWIDTYIRDASHIVPEFVAVVRDMSADETADFHQHLRINFADIVDRYEDAAA